MNIVQVSGFVLPVKDYGGIERVIYWLCGALADLGHNVSLIAPLGSYHENENVKVSGYDVNQNITELIPKDTDVVHIHHTTHIENTDIVGPHKWICTMHGLNKSSITNKYPENIVGISSNHAASHNLKYFVYNGVDSSEFKFNDTTEDKFLFFSKVSYPRKGVHTAIKLAKELKLNLEIYGGDRKKLLRNPMSYLSSFRKSINVRGYASGETKAQAFANAKALIFPINFPEPFGLVMVESMMSGTPVIGFNKGSVAEGIGESGGFVVNYYAQMKDAINKISDVDRRLSRQYAIDKFDISVCAKNYVKQYYRVMAKT